jgi:hypothetical protein
MANFNCALIRAFALKYLAIDVVLEMASFSGCPEKDIDVLVKAEIHPIRRNSLWLVFGLAPVGSRVQY